MTPKQLTKARQKLKMTQVELAAELDLSRCMISMMENGRKPIMRTTELAIKYLLQNR